MDQPIEIFEDLSIISESIIQDKYTSLLSDKTWKEKCLIAQNPKTVSQALDVLSNDLEAKIRHLVAKNQNTSIKTLEKLSKDSHKEIRKNIAQNEFIPCHILKNLAQDDSDEGLLALMENSNFNSGILSILIENLKNKDAKIKNFLKSNLIPIAVQDMLLQLHLNDKNFIFLLSEYSSSFGNSKNTLDYIVDIVEKAEETNRLNYIETVEKLPKKLLTNPHLPTYLLKRLIPVFPIIGCSGTVNIHYTKTYDLIFNHPSTTKEMFLDFFRKINNYLNHNIFSDHDTITAEEANTRLAENPNTPIEILESISKLIIDRERGINYETTKAFAKNPASNLKILNDLVKLNCSNVRYALINRTEELEHEIQFQLLKDKLIWKNIANKTSNLKILEYLMDNGHQNVKKIISANIHSTSEMLDFLSYEKNNQENIVKNINTNSEILEKLSTENDLKREIINHRNVSIKILQTLRNDTDPNIRDKAKKRLKEIK